MHAVTVNPICHSYKFGTNTMHTINLQNYLEWHIEKRGQRDCSRRKHRRFKKMQQRKSASGRPLGTDGSDFSYRMVIDPRYTKVAQGKSRLCAIILAQAISQVVGVIWILLLASQNTHLDTLAVVSIASGCFSVAVGELGRRRSHVTLLKLYVVASSISMVTSIAEIIGKGLSFEVQNAKAFKKFEAVEAGRVLLSAPLQVFAFITTVLLIQNMSPKRGS